MRQGLDSAAAGQTLQVMSEVESHPPDSKVEVHRIRRMSGRDPARAASDGHAAGVALRPHVRDRLRHRGLRVRPSARRGPRRIGVGLVRVRDVLHLLGVDQLQLVRVGLRHRRLDLPADDDAADGRRHHSGARSSRDVRLDRRGRARRQPGDGGRLRGDANRVGGAVVTRGQAGPAATHGMPHLRRGRHRRADRLDRHDPGQHVGCHDVRVGGGVGGLRDVRAVAGRATHGRHALARPSHRRALFAAHHHRARRGRRRHRRLAVGGCRARRAGAWTPCWSRWREPG